MKIFISHASKDNHIVKKIVKIFDKHRIDYWVDFKQLEIDAKITSEINKAIRESTHFLLVWSKNAENSEWVDNEVSASSSPDYKNLIKIPFALDATKMPALDFSSIFKNKINLDTITTETEKIIEKITRDFDSEMDRFKKRIRKDYRNFSNFRKEPPLIDGFRNSDGHAYFVKQPYETLEYKEKNTEMIFQNTSQNKFILKSFFYLLSEIMGQASLHYVIMF